MDPANCYKQFSYSNQCDQTGRILEEYGGTKQGTGETEVKRTEAKTEAAEERAKQAGEEICQRETD